MGEVHGAPGSGNEGEMGKGRQAVMPQGSGSGAGREGREGKVGSRWGQVWWGESRQNAAATRRKARQASENARQEAGEEGASKAQPAHKGWGGGEIPSVPTVRRAYV